MTNVSPLPRTLAHVLLEIASVEQAHREGERAYYAADDGSSGCFRIGDRLAAIDERLSELRAEARRMVEQATGVTWRQLEEASL